MANKLVACRKCGIKHRCRKKNPITTLRANLQHLDKTIDKLMTRLEQPKATEK